MPGRICITILCFFLSSFLILQPSLSFLNQLNNNFRKYNRRSDLLHSHASTSTRPTIILGTATTCSSDNKKLDEEHNFVGHKLILWRGEKTHGNSLQFRHAEFKSSLSTILYERNEDYKDDISFKFVSALSSDFDASESMSEYQITAYENALQYVQVHHDGTNHSKENQNTGRFVDISNQMWIETVERCSLIRDIYEVVAVGITYEELAKNAIKNNLLDDMMINNGSSDDHKSWRIRLRQYGSTASTESKSKQYGKKMRSPMTQERNAVMQLKELLINFGGDVDLKHADVSIYVMEGLISSQDGNRDKKVLARLLTKGGGGNERSMSIIAPTTRICVTNTPLPPVEAFTLCNVARIKRGDRVLDPFAGSCTTLLAATMLTSNAVKTVGIEVAHNGQVNRAHILDDFALRNLTMPAALIHGDAMDAIVREQARASVNNEAFDVIVTDPPYNIRETTKFCVDPPLVQLVKCMAQDRRDGKRLLKKKGRLVSFVPNEQGHDVALGMPSVQDLNEAGLEFCQMLEQPLNDSLSRWLVVYKCTR